MKKAVLFVAAALTLATAACGNGSSDLPAPSDVEGSDVRAPSDVEAPDETARSDAQPPDNVDVLLPNDVDGPDQGDVQVPSDVEGPELADAPVPTDVEGSDLPAPSDVEEPDVPAFVCEPGTKDCDKDPENRCEATIGSVDHCAGCYDACSTNHAMPVCQEGACYLACEPGFDDCNLDVTDGCEQSLLEKEHCGVCGNECADACLNGACTGCDAALPLDSQDPMDAAKALGICSGVVWAKWVQPDGMPPPAGMEPNYHLGHGMLTGFGPNVAPTEGTRLLALSSGTARQPSDPGFQAPGGFDKGYVSSHPAGFPLESPSCPGVVTGQPHDAIALELTLKVPPFVVGYSFLSNFYTYEWPQYICSQYNDFFVALQYPFPAGSLSGNVVFDSYGNPVSVNNALMSVCGCSGGPPCTAGGVLYDCPLGSSLLVGSGFGADTAGADHAATGWLRTTAPVEPGSEVTIRFAIYDSGDGVLDSTVLLDQFEWVLDPVVVGTQPAL